VSAQTGAAPAPVAAGAAASSGDAASGLLPPLPENGSSAGGESGASDKLAAGTSQTAAGPASPGAGQGGAEPGQGPAARLDAQAGAAGSQAALAAASALLPEDAELPAGIPEPGTGTEFITASVRGGDLNGAMRTESLQTPNQTQSSHAATQVAAEIVRNLKNGHTRFQMRFDPPELGRVDVNMRVSADGSVQAHLIVERPETLDMFLRDQRGLERALEAAGMSADTGDLQFSLKQDGGGDFASGQGDGDRQSASAEDASDGSSDTDQEAGDRVRLMLAEQRGGLDMKV
ncbi:MAG: flagellar hook-length control protein FliK, partial [Roseibium sp.]